MPEMFLLTVKSDNNQVSSMNINKLNSVFTKFNVKWQEKGSQHVGSSQEAEWYKWLKNRQRSGFSSGKSWKWVTRWESQYNLIYILKDHSSGSPSQNSSVFPHLSGWDSRLWNWIVWGQILPPPLTYQWLLMSFMTSLNHHILIF